MAEAALAAIFSDFTSELVAALPEFPSDDPNHPGRFLLMADVTGPDGGTRGFAEGTDTLT